MTLTEKLKRMKVKLSIVNLTAPKKKEPSKDRHDRHTQYYGFS